MKPEIRIFTTPEQLAEACAKEIVDMVREAQKAHRTIHVLLPGGKTPACLFRALARKQGGGLNWDHVHLFWGDERCVPPDHPESNFRMAKEILLNHISIPDSNIHRIHAEEDPAGEARRYSGELLTVPLSPDGMPVFDLVLLGLGTDGHTASIFPDRLDLFQSSDLCVATVHPVTGQHRITVTGKVLSIALQLIFIVTGKDKANIVAAIFRHSSSSEKYPAAKIAPANGTLTWFLDNESAMLLNDTEHVENK